MKSKQKIFNILIDDGNSEESLKKFESFLNNKKQHLIFTPNPEILNLAYRDKNFKDILNSADLSLPDGSGIIIMGKLLGYKFKKLTGVDYFIKSLNVLNQRKERVYLLGSAPENLKKVILNIKTKYPDLIISGYLDKFIVGKNGKSEKNQSVISAINNFKPSVIFVGLGASKQERWLYENLNKLPDVKIGMSVGGTFDFISGKIKRAPKLIQNLYLEWLWRLMFEPLKSKPKRFLRILNAIIIFPLLVIFEKIKNPHQ